MITLKNVKKTYNKRKQNANRVIDDVSLELPSTGLTVLLGESGSGKTTMLNAISGLDKVDEGTITFEDKVFDSYNTAAWDKLRTKDIGYIFQNYYLLPYETVYDNIRLTLKMIGINDEKSINARVEYLLSVVGLSGYKHRMANQLSGGQQQRVAIVRALAKDPKVIIADEPTGNLDSRNTLEVMQIIKTISKGKLVVMVTHEESLATSYGDKIIRIVDGKIDSIIDNEEKTRHTKTHETDIYLKDLKHVHESDSVNVFMDESSDTPPQARIILKNKTLYIDVDHEVYNKVYMMDNESDVKIHNASREEVSKTKEELPTFNYGEQFPTSKDEDLKQVISFKHAFERSFKSLRRTGKFMKFLFLGFFFGATIFALAVAMFTNIYFIDDEDVLNAPKYTYYGNVDESFNDFYTFENLEEVKTYASEHDAINDYYVGYEETSVRFKLPKFYQTSGSTNQRAHMGLLSEVNANDLIAGSMPSDATGILIDSNLADRMLRNGLLPNLGIKTYSDLLSLDAEVSDEGFPIEISGIVESEAPIFYGNKALKMTLDHSSFYALDLIPDDMYTLLGGDLPTASNEVLMPLNMVPLDAIDGPNTIDISAIDPVMIDNIEYDVVGVYEIDTLSGVNTRFVATSEALEKRAFNSNNAKAYFYVNDPEAYEAQRDSSQAPLNNMYEQAYQIEYENRRMSSGGLIVFSVVTLVATAAAFYFIIRSSMMKRIYEIGVYRSLGVRRFDIIKLFLIEILLITTLSSVLGFLAMTYVLNEVVQASGELVDVFNVNVFTITGGLLIIYALNVLFGLFPLFGLLRKTPAQIQTVYDL